MYQPKYVVSKLFKSIWKGISFYFNMLVFLPCSWFSKRLRYCRHGNLKQQLGVWMKNQEVQKIRWCLTKNALKFQYLGAKIRFLGEERCYFSRYILVSIYAWDFRSDCTLIIKLKKKNPDISRLSKLPENVWKSSKHFFLSGFFTNIHESQDCRGRGRGFLQLLTTTSTRFTDN